MVVKYLSPNLCIVCGYSISDPVCKRCYIKQIEILLADLNLHEIVNEIILKKIKNKFPTETLTDMECILCKKDNVTVCRYCFSVILKDTLKELNFTEEMIENFGYNPLYEENSLEKESMLGIKDQSMAIAQKR